MRPKRFLPGWAVTASTAATAVIAVLASMTTSAQATPAAPAAVATQAAGAAPAQPSGRILHAGDPSAIPGSYIVVLKDPVGVKAVASTAEGLAARYGGSVDRTYGDALHGFSATLSKKAAERLAVDPSVAYVEQDRTISIAGTQSPTPSWGLDRIDQKALPLNDSYTYADNGAGVKAYIVDTGINFTHQDFGGRAISGVNILAQGTPATDCHGHGTHVAGTVGGSSHGVAKGVTLVGVRVMNCTGAGAYGDVIAGVDWVTADHAAGAPAVANVSLGGPFSQALNDAITGAINDGVVFSVAAVNDRSDACAYSPASTPDAITVGATTRTDARAAYSNYGPCVDVFAPGSDITSPWIGSNTATNTISGTSMATPHVTGAAALVLVANPGFTPRQVRDKLAVNSAVYNKVTDPGAGSPNRLLNVSAVQPPSQDFALAVTPGSGTAGIGGTLSTTVSTTTTVGGPEPVALSVTGLPPGATASFTPSTVTSGATSTLSITTTSATPPGTYPLTIIGGGTVHTQNAFFTLTVSTRPGCSVTNATDVPIAEGSSQPAAQSPAAVSGCSGTLGASTVEVHIKHPYISDLIVTLVSPKGKVYTLHNRTGISAVDIDRTYPLDLSGETANGTWKLLARDMAKLGTAGFIDSWTLNLGTSGT
ncbi:S8 family peptidase [Streptomyces californicus]|uniref:S8 family peptidase n=1 Tax=Streptomyces californicus TaxID=67351 RepID=UPI00379A8605